MDLLAIPNDYIISQNETLFREIKEKYISVTAEDFQLNTSFALIDRHHNVSFYRPYIAGLEYLSGQKMNFDFGNAKNLINSIENDVHVSMMDVIEAGKKAIMRQSKRHWDKNPFFCEFSLDTLEVNGFTAEGRPTRYNISHAVVDFNLSSGTRSRLAEKYLSETDMIVYSTDTSLKNHPKIVFIDL